MVVESLAGLPSIVIVLVLYLGYVASWKRSIPLMAITALVAVFIAINYGSPLGLLLNISPDVVWSDLLMKVMPSVMLAVTGALGYFYSFNHKTVHALAMAFLMAASLVMGW